MAMQRVQIAGVQNTIVHVVKTEVVPKMKVVPWSMAPSSQVGPHVRSEADHAGSAQGTTDVRVTETAEVSALNPAQPTDMSTKASHVSTTKAA